MLKANKVENAREQKLEKLCQGAKMGFAKINIRDTATQLVLRTFNPARKLQQDVVTNISQQMLDGEIKSRSNPLLIAVDEGDVIQTCLKDTHDTDQVTSPLENAVFRSQDTALFVLAGYHRISAVNEVINTIEERIKSCHQELDDLEDESARDDEDWNGSTHDEGESKDSGFPELQKKPRKVLLEHIECLGALQRDIEVWPVVFYNLRQSWLPEREN